MRGLRRPGWLLPFGLPLAPWPVLLWLGHFPDYPLGRHSAPALSSVAGYAAEIIAAATALGLAALLPSKPARPYWPLWAIFAVSNGYLLWWYLDSHASMYA